MKVYHIGFLELRQPGDVVAHARSVDGEQSFATATVAKVDFEPFECKLHLEPGRWLEADDVCALRWQAAVATEQGGVDTLLPQGFEQAQGGYGSPAGVVGCVDKKYFQG